MTGVVVVITVVSGSVVVTGTGASVRICVVVVTCGAVGGGSVVTVNGPSE